MEKKIKVLDILWYRCRISIWGDVYGELSVPVVVVAVETTIRETTEEKTTQQAITVAFHDTYSEKTKTITVRELDRLSFEHEATEVRIP